MKPLTSHLVLSFWIFCFSARGQEKTSFGLSGAYNLPLQTISVGTRARIPLTPRLSLNPQIRYAPAFNDFHEFSAGANLHYYFIRSPARQDTDSPKFAAYLLAGGHYNRWINYSPSLNPLAKANNLLPEAGLGLVTGGNIFRIFFEAKYNPLWLEPSAEAGLLISPFNRPRKLKCYY